MTRHYYVDSTTLRGALDTETRYVVPDYQRQYAWKDEQVLDLWHDLMDIYISNPNKRHEEYLLGTMVTLSKPHSKPHSEDILLVDGQQRLVTLTLLFCAIRDNLYDYLGDTDNSSNEIVKRLIKQLNDMVQNRADIALNNSDDNDILHTIYKRNALDIGETTPSKKALRDNYNLLLGKAKELCKKCGLNGGQKISSIQILEDVISDLKDKIYFSRIKLLNEDYVYPVFITLNSTGQKLRQSDIIKSHLMRHGKDREKIECLWYDINELEDPDGFLYYSMLSREYEGDDVQKTKMFRHIKERYVTQDDVDEYVDGLKIDLEIIKTIYDPDRLTNTGEYYVDFRHVLGGVQLIDAKYFLRPIIAACRTWTFDFSKSKDLICFLSKFFFMYRTVCKLDIDFLKASSKTLTKQIADNETLEAMYCTLLKDNTLKRIQKSFKESFKENIRKLTRNVALYILRSLEHKMHTPGTSTRAHLDELELEHIFPRNPKVSAWPNKDALSEHTWRLGNLTLLYAGWNKALKNYSFAIKSRGDEPNKEKSYSSSDIKLNEYVTEHEEWTVNAMEYYENKLVEEAYRVWDLTPYTRSQP